MSNETPRLTGPPSVRGPGWWIIPSLALIGLFIALVYVQKNQMHGEKASGSPSVEESLTEPQTPQKQEPSQVPRKTP